MNMPNIIQADQTTSLSDYKLVRLQIGQNMLIREIEDKDLQVITDIYNSNKEFLIHHLGHDRVDRDFILHEITEMKEHGFSSTIIEDDGKPVVWIP